MENKRRKIPKNKNTRYYYDVKGNKQSERDPYSEKNFGQSKHFEMDRNKSWNESPKDIMDYLYFDGVLDKLKIGFDDDDDKVIFIENVVKEVEKKAVASSCDKKTSQVLQSMLDILNDANFFIKFMEAISSDIRQICTNQFGSHVVESLIKLGLRLLQDENKPYYNDVLSSFIKFGKYCLNNTDYFLSEVYASHVLRTLVETWGGVKLNEKITRSRKSRKLKRRFQSDNEDNETVEGNPTGTILTNVPEEFIPYLKEFYEKIENRKDLVNCSMDSKVSCILQTLLVALQQRIPELCQKFSKSLMKELYTKDSKDNLPETFSHHSSSCMIEMIIQVSDEETLLWLWKKFFQNSMKLLIQCPIANFIAQRLFKVIQNKEQFQEMLESTFPLFEDILENGFPGIIVRITEACVRLGTGQPQFVTAIMKAFHCSEPERQVSLASVVMLLMTYDIFKENIDNQNSLFQDINYHGSLIVQYMLNFFKPFRIVNSLLEMKEVLKIVACNPKGSRIFDAYAKSTYVGEKNREKLLHLIQPYMAELASDKHGSRTIEALWLASSVKHRIIIAQHLTEHEDEIKPPYCFFLQKKFALSHFKLRNKEWREIQEEEIKKRKIFKDFITK